MDLRQPPNPGGRKPGAWQKSERHDGEQVTTTLTLYGDQWQAILMGVDRDGLSTDTQQALAALTTAHDREMS